jgi:hypothetical protein
MEYDGHAFVPAEPVPFKAGEKVEVEFVTSPSDLTPDERWERIRATFGQYRAPDGFDWNLSREDFYRDDD